MGMIAGAAAAILWIRWGPTFRQLEGAWVPDEIKDHPKQSANGSLWPTWAYQLYLRYRLGNLSPSSFILTCIQVLSFLSDSPTRPQKHPFSSCWVHSCGCHSPPWLPRVSIPGLHDSPSFLLSASTSGWGWHHPAACTESQDCTHKSSS